MHSCEHILNQTMDRLFGCGRCFSAHIEKKKSKCDYHFDRPLTDEEIRLVENRVNHVIQSDLRVTETYLSKSEAAKKYDLDRVPDDTGEEVRGIRIIGIGDYDACPCIGPHVASTAEIGTFNITSTGFENGILRIRFKLKKPV